MVEERFLIERHEVEIVKGHELRRFLCGRFRCRVVIHEPAGDIRVQAVGDNVEEVLVVLVRAVVYLREKTDLVHGADKGKIR